MISNMNMILVAAIVVGFGAASIALYGRYQTLPAFLTGPHICKLEAGGCQVLFRTKNAALLGIPNSALGVLYYPLLGAGLIFHWPFVILFLSATLAFLMTVVLAWILIRDKLECRICWTGHFSNILIWLILLFRLIISK
jgi:uncharacterized membrane protein